MHEHKKPKPCKHELKFCDHCDTVYCEKCQTEWKKTTYQGKSDILQKIFEDEKNKNRPNNPLPWRPEKIYMSVKESHNHV